jgi:hypothetical protein
MIRTIKRVGVLGVSILAFGLVLTGSQVAWAKHKHAPAHGSLAPIAPSSSVTTCGTLSANGTIYLVTANLIQVGTGDCIVLSGDDDTLDFQRHTVTGPGTGTSIGAGIKITGSEDVVEGTNNTVSGFAVGVLDQGTDTLGDQVNMVGNGIGLEMTSVEDFGGGSTQLWTNFSTTNNVAQGVFMNGCKDECTIEEFDASSNGADGVLVQNSQGPRIKIFTADSNGGDGVHIGCTSGCGTNSTVKVVDAPLGLLNPDVAVTLNKGDGIFLDASEASNKDQVVLVEAMGNGVVAGFDLHDATSTCGSNHWVHNNYGTADAAGVSNPPGPLPCIPNASDL